MGPSASIEFRQRTFVAPDLLCVSSFHSFILFLVCPKQSSRKWFACTHAQRSHRKPSRSQQRPFVAPDLLFVSSFHSFMLFLLYPKQTSRKWFACTHAQRSHRNPSRSQQRPFLAPDLLFVSSIHSFDFVLVLSQTRLTEVVRVHSPSTQS